MDAAAETQATTTNEGEQTQAATEAVATGGEQSQEVAAGEQAPAEQQEAKPASEVPEKYELNPGEGKEFDSEFLQVYEETARELELSNEKAQKIIDKLGPVLERRQAERIEAVRNEWAEQSKVDKEFGGEKLAENLAVAKQALDKFGTPELKELINKSGFGNHPELIRFFYRAGKATTPDTVVTGREAQGKTGPKNFGDFASALYG